MKSILYKIMIIGLILSVFSSCTKDFAKINKDPNRPNEPDAKLLLSNAIRAIGNQGNGIAGWAKDIYPQYISEIIYTNESQFQNRYYNFYPYYEGPLLDLELVIKLNTDSISIKKSKEYGLNVNQIAVSRILKVFYFMHMTDRWGMIPYSESLKGKLNLKAKYDNQKDIYDSFFKELKEASEQIVVADKLHGDFLLEDMAQWKRWANTLRMIAAIHISQVDPAKAKSEFAAGLAAGAITNNEQNVYFKYLPDAINQNPLYNNYFATNRVDYAISEKLLNTLVKLSDPRLQVYAKPTVKTGEYKGMPFGVDREGNPNNKETVSLIGDKFTAQNYALPLTTFAQVEFMKAEAAFRGWIPGSAEEFYKSGIEASMNQHGKTTPAAYLEHPDVKYQAAKGLELIINQKWIANYQANGYESWVDWRRTGFPTLHPGPNPQSVHKGIPYRQAYPTSEEGLNPESYKAAIEAQGANDLNVKVWWDKD